MRRRELIESCERLVRFIRAEALATEAELAEHRPARRGASLDDWHWYRCQLVRLWGRKEQRDLDAAAADAAVIQALAAEPLELVLAAGTATAPERRVRVYPKSFEALLHLHALDEAVAWLAARRAVLRDVATPEDLTLLDRVATELGYQQGRIVWIATHPGPGLPYDPWSDERPALPDPARAFDPWALLRIHQAFVTVNAARLQALDRLLDPATEGGERPTWSVFFGAMAMKMKTDVGRLLRDASLATLLATVRLATPAAAAEEMAEAMS